ncbi:hypothetical protein [Georgenia subflava]|uniref:Uncharacterized protein n=1 Tax=Georgenia subflava TaxID=1622177 RepID=A0A6N7EG17_9MICO|nr:hypothetical protein [Georgenia subflava]MPV35898.1 hypothetical protein [Georgenia subflava]
MPWEAQCREGACVTAQDKARHAGEVLPRIAAEHPVPGGDRRADARDTTGKITVPSQVIFPVVYEPPPSGD